MRRTIKIILVMIGMLVIMSSLSFGVETYTDINVAVGDTLTLDSDKIYYVNSNSVVSGHLIIGDNTTVIFSDNIILRVRGQLTAGNNVRLTAAPGTLWNGLTVENGATIIGSEISMSDTGIHITNNVLQPFIQNVTLTNNNRDVRLYLDMANTDLSTCIVEDAISIYGSTTRSVMLNNTYSYMSEGDLRIAQSTTLTIPEGTELLLGYRDIVYVDGVLILNGSENNHISINEAKVNEPWNSIIIGATGNLNMYYTDIRGGGQNSAPFVTKKDQGQLTANFVTMTSGNRGYYLSGAGDVNIKDSQIDDFIIGIYFRGSDASISDVTISGSATYGIELTYVSSYDLPLPTFNNVTMTNNKQDVRMPIDMAGTVFNNCTLEDDVSIYGSTTRNVTLNNIYPYMSEGDLRVSQSTTLTIPEGTELFFGHKDIVYVDGTLSLNGSENNHITINETKVNEPWNSIIIGATGNLNMQYTDIRGGGQNSAPFVTKKDQGQLTANFVTMTSGNRGYYLSGAGDVNIKDSQINNFSIGIYFRGSNASISDVTISGSTSYGIELTYVSSYDLPLPTFNNVTMTNNKQDVRMPIDMAGAVFNNCTLEDDVSIYGSTTRNVTLNNKYPYMSEGDLRVSQSTILTIPEGTELLFGHKDIVYVDGVLNLNGSENNHITINETKVNEPWNSIIIGATGQLNMSYTDLSGGSQNSAPFITKKDQGQLTANHVTMTSGYRGYYLTGTGGSSISNSSLRAFEDGVTVNGSNPVILGNTIEDCVNGIYVNGHSNPIIKNNTIKSNQYGIISYAINEFVVGGTPLERNDFLGNTIGINSTANQIDARNNWWNSNLGPNHVSNPTGDGDPVSDFVLFDPYYIKAIPYGDLSFELVNDSILEDGGILTVKVVRKNGSAGTVGVDYSVIGGSASIEDYQLIAGTIPFAEGETEKYIDITIINDTTFEPDETLELGLNNITGGASLGVNSNLTITILNDDHSNYPPTDILLDSNHIFEKQDVGTVVGELSCDDVDVVDTSTYALIAGDGDLDNSLFSISNDSLVTAQILDCDVKIECSVRLQVTDSVGNTYEKKFVIYIDDKNGIPTSQDYAFSIRLNETLVDQLIAQDAEHDELTYKIRTDVTKGQLSLDETDGSFNYVPNQLGSDSFQFYVFDGVNESIDYTVNIETTASNVGALESLLVTGGSLNPTFSSETLTYNMTTNDSSVTLTGQVKYDGTLSISEVNQTVTPNFTKTINLNVGQNTIALVVTSGDGLIETVYTVNITRQVVQSDSGTVVTPDPVEEPDTVKRPSITPDPVEVVLEEEETPLGSITFNQPYVSGYLNNQFLPDGYVTRAEVATMLAKITGKQLTESKFNLKDLVKTHWAYNYIQTALEYSLFIGYPDGEFKPDISITRAELSAVVIKYYSLIGKKIDMVSEYDFADLSKNHWAYDEIQLLCNAGLVSGYEDKTYRPDQYTTRAEVVVILNKMIGRNEVDGDSKFRDVPTSHWACGAINAATEIMIDGQ